LPRHFKDLPIRSGHKSNRFQACEMAALKPIAVYGLEVPADDIAIEADGSVPYPATVSNHLHIDRIYLANT
jgi:hypothetical protein